jgi:hypothetical protein
MQLHLIFYEKPGITMNFPTIIHYWHLFMSQIVLTYSEHPQQTASQKKLCAVKL